MLVADDIVLHGELRGIVLDGLTEHIQEWTPRCMFFADDIVLHGESREELSGRLETWRQALEMYGFRLSRSMT